MACEGFYISIPIGIFIVIYALLIVKKAGEHDRDMDLYMYVIKPEESRIYKKGIYQYIRHPRILVRFTLSFGFAIIANNFLAILVVFTHYIPYSVYFIISDKELSRRFADEFKTYKKEVPALIPKLKNWGKYLKLVFSKKMI